MRKEYNIMWLDDEFQKKRSLADGYAENVTNYLKDKGYIANIIKCSNYPEAIHELEKKIKVDLFISDFNIGDQTSGLDFLLSCRTYYRQEMMLYSNNSMEQIKSHILSYFKTPSVELSFFTKFSFQSAMTKSILLKSFYEIIDLTLYRWEELNALRGLYLAEISQCEFNIKDHIVRLQNDSSFRTLVTDNMSSHTHLRLKAKEQLSSLIRKILTSTLSMDDHDFTFANCQYLLCSYDNSEDSLNSKWRNIRMLRNGFAHVNERENSIILSDGTIILENDISRYRIKLLDFVDLIETLITSMNQTPTTV